MLLAFLEFTAAWANDFRDDGCVITDAAAEMKCAVARLKRERVDPSREGAGLAVVDVFRAVERDDDVVIKIARVVGSDVRGFAQTGHGQSAGLRRADLPGRGASRSASSLLGKLCHLHMVAIEQAARGVFHGGDSKPVTDLRLHQA